MYYCKANYATDISMYKVSFFYLFVCSQHCKMFQIKFEGLDETYILLYTIVMFLRKIKTFSLNFIQFGSCAEVVWIKSKLS
jgi:hypothetical protein